MDYSYYNFLKMIFIIRAVIYSYVIAAIYLVKEFFGRWGKIKRDVLSGIKICKRDGQIAIITGGTGGIGLETVRCLLSNGMQVIIGSNISPELCESVLETLQKEFPNSKVDIWYVDLSSMKSVKKFAEKFLKTGLPLHILINNAGIMYAPFTLTEDDFESHFAINYLSHCLLIKLLLPCLRRTGYNRHFSRIINVASCIHFPGEINFEDLQSNEVYSKYHAYMQSKLAQVMFTQYLHQYLRSEGYHVTVNCVHPGIVNSDLYQYIWWASYVAPLLFKTTSEGAETTLYAVFSEELEGVGGKYLEECSFVKPSKYSRDKELQKALWDTTWKLLNKWSQVNISNERILLEL